MVHISNIPRLVCIRYIVVYTRQLYWYVLIGWHLSVLVCMDTLKWLGGTYRYVHGMARRVCIRIYTICTTTTVTTYQTIIYAKYVHIDIHPNYESIPIMNQTSQYLYTVTVHGDISQFTATYQNSPLHTNTYQWYHRTKNMPKYAHNIGPYERCIHTDCIHPVYQLCTQKLFRYRHWYIILSQIRWSNGVIFCK